MIIDHYLFKKCSRLETSGMNFSDLISRHDWTFNYLKTLGVIHIYTNPIKVTIQTNQMSRPLSKGTRSNFPMRRWIRRQIPTPKLQQKNKDLWLFVIKTIFLANPTMGSIWIASFKFMSSLGELHEWINFLPLKCLKRVSNEAVIGVTNFPMLFASQVSVLDICNT